MRQGRGLIVALLGGLFIGCATGEPVYSTSWLDRLRACQGPTGPDVVQLDVALIERPVGDRYLNEDLWPLVDEQAVALERKAVLEDNGFRIGQVSGIPPAGLLELLTSERSCVNPRSIRLHAGKPTTLVLGRVREHCQFQVHQEGRTDTAALDQAQCVLVVVPTLTADGRTRLQFTPEVRHGERSQRIRAVPDQSGYVVEEQQPTESYRALGWEVTVAPNEYVIVGGRFDRPETLGHVGFIQREGEFPVQRLLAVRTARPLPGLTSEPAESEERAPPLAVQAALTNVGGPP